ncbi:MAG: FAD-binding oxidoreductase [Crocinitomicaceae bacterium]|nr:FAD-binding oxidoreductase [Crocinitomicaceae bacterium]MDP4798193.1 FAD-binding oxidoreductase [Crocinitomicaceae bacterium]MDP4867241.1 FAD-binding oxidoreductase [Crocinitomicaceae bacterium]MDP5099468.1 FAD-binding oxidoreductase [Crocinitomicaceae bacterium]
MLNIEQLSFWEKQSYFEEIDFLIIGAGIVGYSTAIHLQEKYPNASILIVERGYLPSGASSKNAGFACFGSATELLDDLDQMDENTVWSTVQKRWEGLNYLKSIIGESNLELEVNGSWDILTSKNADKIPFVRSKIDYLNQQIEAITGEKKVYSEDHGLSKKFNFQGIETSINNRLEGQINTGKMIHTFYQKAIEKGIKVLFGIEVLSFESTENKVLINISQGEITARNLLICTNGFAAQLIDEDVQPARAQVIVTSPIPNLQMKGTFHYDQGYYYFRNVDNRILLGGGRNLDFKGETTTQMETTDLVMNSLNKLLKEVIIPNTPYSIEYKWAGIMGVGSTKAPIVKKVKPNVGIGVRMGGMGVAIGSLIGKELSELY